jgi:hypothetical protein
MRYEAIFARDGSTIYRHQFAIARAEDFGAGIAAAYAGFRTEHSVEELLSDDMIMLVQKAARSIGVA